MLKRLIIGALAILCLLILTVCVNWAIENIESYQQEDNTGLSAHARRNQFLAADYFLKQSGVPVESLSGRSILYQLPSPDDSLLIADINIELSETRQQALKDWITKGGHLITTTSNFSVDSEQNILLKMFSIEGIKNESNQQHPSKENNLLEVSFEETGTPLNISINPGYSLKFNEELYPDAALIGADNGIQLIQLDIGEGLLTIVSDLDFLKNNNIAQHDHAYFLWKLMNDGKKLWISYSNNMPSLWLKGWKYNPYLIISCLFLCLLFFWSLWQSFGPPDKISELNRRDIMQQLSAVGRFHLKTDRAVNLLEDNRKSMHQALQKKHPVLRNMNNSEQTEWLAKRIGVAQNIIDEALNAQAGNDTQLLQISRALQHIRKNS